jgi:hypothetical protein
MTISDLVATRVLQEGTNLGPLGPVPPTVNRFSSERATGSVVEQGKPAEHWATRDDLTAMLQLGLVESPTKQMMAANSPQWTASA